MKDALKTIFGVVMFFLALHFVHTYLYRPLAGYWGNRFLAFLAVYPGGLLFMSALSVICGQSRAQLWANIKWLAFSAVIAVICYAGLIFVFFNTELSHSQTLWDFFHPGHHMFLASITGFAFVCVCIAYFFWDDSTPDLGPRRRHYRGKALLSFQEARNISRKARSEDDPGLFWGGLRLPSEAATTHFCVTGATGSGKTITIRFLMQSVLPKIESGTNSRALVYDAKQDILSILSGMELKCRVITLNPFDERSAAWNMAADITSPATAQQIATILIPENKHASQPFFSDAARHLLTGVFISFIRTCPEAWTLRDVILAMKSRGRLCEVLGRVPETRDLLENLKNDITAQNIMSTIQTRLQRYEFIAATWDRAGESINLRDWLNGEYILVLGNDEATRSALDAINQVIFKRLSELALAESESETRRTWVFLDEVREAGELQGLSSLLTKGRSKGVCVVLGFQDIEGLREVYGSKVANEIIGQCANKAILRLESPETAQWASSLFGVNESIVTTRSQSIGSGTSNGRGGEGAFASTNQSTSQSFVKAENVLPSEFMNIAPTTRKTGLTGYYQSPYVGAYSVTLTPEWLTQSLRTPNPTVENFLPRPETSHYLRPWNEKDLERLNLESLSPLAAQVTQERQGSITLGSEPRQWQQEGEVNILEGVGEGKIEL